MKADVIDLETLRAEGLIGHDIRKVKIINTGELQRAVTVKGIAVTKGAKAVIETAGGKVE
jgi:large subunit ribosomal protein L15